MQYPVPQFTDVEDRIIGILTLKQFLILFGTGMILFLVYSATKSIPVLIIFGLLLGLPALAVAFGKVNGRPMYQAFPFILRYFTSPKELVFHKEALHMTDEIKVKDVETKVEQVAEQQPVTAEQKRKKLEEINRMLQQEAAEQQELLRRGGMR